MATKWYYQVMGGVIGPLSAATLLQHAQQGRLTRDTPVRRNDSDRWVPARKEKGLFPTFPLTTETHAALPDQGSNESAVFRPASDQSGAVHERRRLVRNASLLVVGLIAVAVAFLVYREQFPSDDRVVAVFRSELRDTSSGWESAELYRSKDRGSDFEYKALHAVYREGGAAFWFGIGINFGLPQFVIVSIPSVSPSKATKSNGQLARFWVNDQGQIESESYYGLVEFSKSTQALLRRKALEFFRAAKEATGY